MLDGKIVGTSELDDVYWIYEHMWYTRMFITTLRWTRRNFLASFRLP